MMNAISLSTALKTEAVLEEIFGKDLHKKRQQSLAFASMSVLGSSTLFLHDLKDGRFGYGMRATHFKTSERRFSTAPEPCAVEFTTECETK